ncbi:MAG TPA: HAD family hydrolase [Patescibacteria group bacterium]|nr:HAD family hydrolase [Patescibacteria group bacterium]
MGKVVLFDIDGTLFNPEKFGKLIRLEFVKLLGIEEEELVRANADYYANLETTTDFNPRDIVAHIADRFGADPEALNKVFWQNNQIYKESLYPDVLDTLKRLSKKHTLGIFSQGNEELQTRKLNASDITQYFDRDHLYIHRRKLDEDVLDQLPEGAVIIDDNRDIAKSASAFREAIWINRRTDDGDPNVETIHTLEEVLYLV